jgi:hypothetical protein
MTSGIISTFLTHPLEIIRAQIQVSQIHANFNADQKSQSIISQLISLTRECKLFNGVAPRLIKKPLSNTMTFLLFEYLEKI